MRRLLYLVLLLNLCAVSLSAQTPTFAYAKGDFSSGSGNGQNGRTTNLANACPSGDLIVMGHQFGAGSGTTTSAWTDDKSDTFTVAVAQPGSTDANQVANLSYTTSCTSGALKMTLTNTGGTPSFVQNISGVFYNTGVKDVSCSAKATSTTVSCSMTSTATNDIYVCYGVEDSATGIALTPGSGYTKVAANISPGYNNSSEDLLEYQVWATAASHPCNFTSGSSQTLQVIGVAFKAATAGGVPSGSYVTYAQGIDLGAGGATTFTSVPFPSASANVLAILAESGSTDSLCSSGTPNCISDSASNTWATNCGGSGQGIVSNALGGNAQVACAVAATAASTTTVTFSRTSGTDADFYELVSIFNPNTPSVDGARVTNTGNQTVAGALTALTGVTPTTTTGFVLTTIGVDADTVPLATSAPSTAVNLCPVENPTQADDPGCQNNYNAFYYSGSTSAQTWTVETSVSGAAYGQWVAIAQRFKDPSSAVVTGQQLNLLGVGTF